MQQPDYAALELLEGDAALRQELGWAEAEAGLVGGAYFAGGVDDERSSGEGAVGLHPFDDGEAVDFGEAEVEDDDAGGDGVADLDLFATVDGVPRVDAPRLQRRHHDAGQIEIVFDDEDHRGVADRRHRIGDFGIAARSRHPTGDGVGVAIERRGRLVGGDDDDRDFVADHVVENVEIAIADDVDENRVRVSLGDDVLKLVD